MVDMASGTQNGNPPPVAMAPKETPAMVVAPQTSSTSIQSRRVSV